MAKTSHKTNSPTTSWKTNETPSRQGDDSSSLSSISNHCLNYNDEDQVISSDNADNVDKPNGKPKKIPSAQFFIPRKSDKMNFNNVPVVILKKMGHWD